MKYEYVVQNRGKRLDKFLSEKNKELSRAMIQKLIENESVTVNGSITKPSYKVSIGDYIKIIIDAPKEISLKSQDLPLDIIYEDNDIIVINKEKGMVVHPGNGNLEGTLANAVLARCKNSLSGISGEIRPRNST